MSTESKKLHNKMAQLLKKWGKQNANRPTENEINKYRKQMKKHLKDPVKYARPKLLRGWWGE